MDDVFAAIANQPASAAEPTQQPQDQGVYEQGGGTEQGRDVTQTQPNAPTGGQLPTSETPQPSQSSAPAQPAISEAEFREAQRKAQEFEQLKYELQALAQQRQAEQERLNEQNRLAQIRKQIKDTAEGLPPEDAFAYIDRQYDMILAEQEGRRQQEMQRQAQQFMATLTEATRPAYARHLAQTNGLPPEYEQRLQMLPPQAMDQYLPVLKQEYAAAKAQQENYQKLMQEMDQIRRSQQANGYAASGAHSVGGVGGQPITIDSDKIEKGSPEHLLSIAGEMFGFTRSQQ